MKTLVFVSYPSNVFWFSVIFPLFSLSSRYFSSLLSKGIVTEIFPSIPHLYQEKYNRSLSRFFTICGFTSIFFSIISIRTFIMKIPKDKQKGSFNLYTTLIITFGIIMDVTFLLLNYLDINKSPFATALNLAPIFHISIGKIPGRLTYIDDVSKIFNFIILLSGIVAILAFNVTCITHKIDLLYFISSIAQFVAFIFCFLKFILIGTIFNGDRFLTLFVEKTERNKNQWAKNANAESFLP